MRDQKRFATFAVVILGLACSSGVNNLPPVGTDGSLVDRLTGGDGGDGQGGKKDGGNSKATVEVTITSPAVDGVARVKEKFVPRVEVRVTVPAGDPEDDLTTVTAQAVDKGGSGMATKSVVLGLTERTGDGVYTYADSPVDIAVLPSGNAELTVKAVTMGGAMGQAKVIFKTDAGPVIKIVKPAVGEFTKGGMTALIEVDDKFFGPVKDVLITLGSATFMPSGPSATGGFSQVIDFDDPTLFDPPLDGPQFLTAIAANSNDTKATASVSFNVDNDGPTIMDTKPPLGTLVGGIVDVEADISDSAGVLESSVIAVIGHGSTTMLQKPLTKVGPTKYSAKFDTRLLPNTFLYPVISYRASDALGNESAVGYAIALDGTPPIADLDPPTGYRHTREVEGLIECSRPFDPVGVDAENDLSVVNQVFELRARVQDLGNFPVGGGIDFNLIAGLGGKDVKLLILDDSSQALVVDTDGDGVCDDINPNLVPTTVPMSSTDALLVNMEPIEPTGIADFHASAPPPGICFSGTDDITIPPPKPICDSTPMTVVPSYTVAFRPNIWTIPPVGSACVGWPLDAANNITDGWICVAVLAADDFGNTQVSRPIRLCVDKDAAGGECDDLSSPPSCTGTVTAVGPPATVDGNASCVPWLSYPAIEIH